MIYFVLALTLILAIASAAISIFAYWSISSMKKSVPDNEAVKKLESRVEQLEQSVAKLSSPKLDPQEKWNNLKEAFKPSGTNNGRSRIS